jgi:hypothetical protein
VPSASTKDQLHTLVEEEEEEADEEEKEEQTPVTPEVDAVQDASIVATPTGRPRPAGLNLRPLSLSPGTLVFNPDLPSPANSPSPRLPPGLKTLTLGSSPSSAASMNKCYPVAQTSPIPAPAFGPTRRSSLTYRPDSMSSCSSDDMPRKRSSISYKPQLATSNLFGLPTPEATPTSERRCSIDSDADISFRTGEQSFRAGEQSFLTQSHNALLSRVADLERALKTHSRPQSLQSEASSEPSDELLQLVADLKSERDELKKDCGGWRERVDDLQKQTGVLAKRVDVERREAWVSRERLSLLEVEKRAVIKQAEEYKDLADSFRIKADALSKELEASQRAYEAQQETVRRGEEAIDEVARLRKMLSDETRRRETLERELEGAGLLDTPVPTQTFAPRVVQMRRWQSFGSESSTTDVESVDGFAVKGLGLNAVVEEDEEAFSDEDNGLLSYEDEGDVDFDDDDDMTESSTISSFGAAARDTAHLLSQAPVAPASSHSRSSSLVRAWSFPTKDSSAPLEPRAEEVDRFFGCLEDLEKSPPLDYAPASRFGNPFCSPSADDDDDLPPFFIPTDVGVEVLDLATPILSNIMEEEEPEEDEDDEEFDDEGNSYDPSDDEFVGEVDEGGIKFTFTIPEDFAAGESPARSPSPAPSSTVVSTPSPASKFATFEEAEDLVFAFPVPKAPETPTKSSSPSPRNSPSSIPRVASLKKSEPAAVQAVALPRPSLIPQPKRFSKPMLVSQPRRPSSVTPSQSSRIPSPVGARTASPPTSRIASPPSNRPHGDAPSLRSPLSMF